MIKKDFEKRAHNYIRHNVKKGYSLNQIKNAFVNYGYEHDFTDKLIRDYAIRRLAVKSVPAFLIIMMIISTFLFYESGITSLVVANKQHNFTDYIGQKFSENTEYVWELENEGKLKSLKISGEVKTNGTARVYLLYENETYLVFDSQKLAEEGFLNIIGFVAASDNIKVKTSEGLTADTQTVLDNLVGDINKTRINANIGIEVDKKKTKKTIDGNLTQAQLLLINTLVDILDNSDKKTKISIDSKFNEANNEQETNVTTNQTNETSVAETNASINETTNTTPEINETMSNVTNENQTKITASKINIGLEYKKDGIYDKDNNGIENIKSIVDLTVENTKFEFDAMEENLCTRWDVYSIDEQKNTLSCYGSNKCCNLVNLESQGGKWNEPFYAAYGQNGAALNNTISAQVIYVDYNFTADEPYSKVYYSQWKNLSVQFYGGFVSFEDICIETCNLPNLDAKSYKLAFDIKDSEIILDSINYVMEGDGSLFNNQPILLSNFSDISLFEDETFTINLRNYFYDEDNDTLTFSAYNESSVNVLVTNETVIIMPNNFVGKTYMFFTANDSSDTITSNIFQIEVKEREKVPVILKSLRKLIGLG